MDLAPADRPAVESPEVCEPFVLPIAESLRQAPDVAGEERSFDRGAYLFRQGDAKSALYRLDSGIVCVTAARPVGPPDVIEMLFPGSLLGLGFLEHHIESAMAVIPCRVTVFPLWAAAALCVSDPEAHDRQAVLTEREFAARRRELVPGRAEDPVRRVAAFLSAMYHMNREQGGNPTYVAEFLKTGDVAAFLGLEVEALGAALAALKDRGLIDRADDGGLVLRDPEGLERL